MLDDDDDDDDDEGRNDAETTQGTSQTQVDTIYKKNVDTVRHVVLPRELAKQVPKSHLMSEDEWRRLGVQQSLGWVHYMIHEPVHFSID
ncbi:hypothetical protein Z043_100215 [Scleropages formosus]|uniref:Cyclin-dependent kinases regulatory subunit n=1 Tax=Scleropages formosus TaxID=113540 RepID=A0A0P7VCE1_SCLFO|nr:hypothetical protein Z043_100215 [Scleropages formosus]